MKRIEKLHLLHFCNLEDITPNQSNFQKHPVFLRHGLQAEVFNMQLVKAQPCTEHQGHNEAHSGHQSKEKARHTGMAGHSLSISISQQKGTNTWFALAAAQG